jgi:hypothetical protein
VRIDHEERDLPSGRAIAVLATSQQLTAVYTFRVAEDRFPADFAMAVQKRMEAIMLSGIAEQRDQAAGREEGTPRSTSRRPGSATSVAPPPPTPTSGT